jgi:hypothetical protein
MVVNSDWQCKLIVDTKFRNVIKKIGNFDIIDGPWIAGGCVRKLWQDLEWKNEDIDIFFANEQQFTKFIKNFDVGNIDNEDNIFTDFKNTLIRKDQYVLTHITENANTYQLTTNGNILGNNVFKVQLVKNRFFKSVSELFNNFDLCTCKFVSDGNNMWATNDAIKSINDWNILINPDYKRDIKVIRLMKYMSYGFNLDDTLYLDILKLIENGTIKKDTEHLDY